ncbi:FHA domain-containing protein [Dactylosporangium sp. CA-092794]|uniref:FHA domain-containing protein n=1 Tax=Dactylosporangium sp. CA-092794 TaxID=3239929 RepID=UPI003D93AD73
MSEPLLLTVVYVGQPDEVFEFRREHQRMSFGRDDGCDIVIWSALNGAELSRVAGYIWRMEGELWLRNVSSAHDMWVEEPGTAPELLRTRRAEGWDPGAARSIGATLANVKAPGGCELLIRQTAGGVAARDPDEAGDLATVRMPPVPERLRPVAAALCEPLLDGGQLPATYREVSLRLGTHTQKQVRTLVAELCQRYEREVPLLHERVSERRRREERELALTGTAQLRRGVWTFDPDTAKEPEEEQEVRRRRALALPDYYEVAHLLVRRRMITAGDVQRLG